MNVLILSWRNFALIALAGLVAGCSSPTLRSSMPGAPESNATYRRFFVPRVAQPQRGRSWMSPAAKANNLLYVANESGTVPIFTWPGLKPVGVLTGFEEPSALCIDNAQDVFVVDYVAKEIYEYAHGGTAPIQILADPSGFPNACAVDRVTGNLAVTNEYGLSGFSTPGDLEVYPKASGTPAEYSDPNIWAYWWPAYDNRGNLFFNGYNSSFTTLYTDKIRKGRDSIKHITLNQTIGFPGGLLWDGQYLLCEDATVNVIYQFAISGTRGTMVGSTNLGGASTVIQIWVTGRNRANPLGTTVVGADVGADAVEVWPYPAGASSPSKTLTETEGIAAPLGVAVSLKRSR
ncbi:MAG: hypothetical protein WB438_09120 [Candidatus Cybelea sp.]